MTKSEAIQEIKTVISKYPLVNYTILCEVLNISIQALEENDKLKSEIGLLKQNIVDMANETDSFQKLDHDLLTKEIEQLKLYATNLINEKNLSEETATSICEKTRRELMMQKENEQLKAELDYYKNECCLLGRVNDELKGGAK